MERRAARGLVNGTEWSQTGVASGYSQPGFVHGPVGTYVSFPGRLDSIN